MATTSYTPAPAALDPRSLADLAALIGRVAVRAPELTSRVERAGGILAAGKIRPIGPERFAARGTDGAVYAVNTADGTCTCPDIQNGAPERNGIRYCKHLLAALLLTRLSAAAIKRRARRDFDLIVAQPEPEPDPETLARVPLLARLAV